MIRFEREVYDKEIVKAMLDQMVIANVGMNDEEGFPYVVPLSFGYEMTDTELIIYTHFSKTGKKLDLLRKDPRVCVEFSIFNDFPDRKYKGHYHDYRSVIARGVTEIVDYKDNPQLWERGYNCLYTCNHREIKPLNERKVVPNMYIGVTRCSFQDVTAKSEFPLRTPEDVPFMNVYEQQEDERPFDISDIIADRKVRREQKEQGLK